MASRRPCDSVRPACEVSISRSLQDKCSVRPAAQTPIHQHLVYIKAHSPLTAETNRKAARIAAATGGRRAGGRPGRPSRCPRPGPRLQRAHPMHSPAAHSAPIEVQSRTLGSRGLCTAQGHLGRPQPRTLPGRPVPPAEPVWHRSPGFRGIPSATRSRASQGPSAAALGGESGHGMELRGPGLCQALAGRPFHQGTRAVPGDMGPIGAAAGGSAADRPLRPARTLTTWPVKRRRSERGRWCGQEPHLPLHRWRD